MGYEIPLAFVPNTPFRFRPQKKQTYFDISGQEKQNTHRSPTVTNAIPHQFAFNYYTLPIETCMDVIYFVIPSILFFPYIYCAINMGNMKNPYIHDERHSTSSVYNNFFNFYRHCQLLLKAYEYNNVGEKKKKKNIYIYIYINKQKKQIKLNITSLITQNL